MQPFGHIYALIDPRTEETRYVGFSTKVIERCMWHVEAKDAEGHRAHWLRSLARDGVTAKVLILEVVETEAAWQEQEIWWIAFMRSQGHGLTNQTDGGEGTRGHIFSEEQRRRVGEASKRAWTSERKVAHSAAMKGNTFGRGGRGSTRSAEQKRRYSDAVAKRRRVPCEHCGKEIIVNNIDRHRTRCGANVF